MSGELISSIMMAIIRKDFHVRFISRSYRIRGRVPRTHKNMIAMRRVADACVWSIEKPWRGV